MRPVNRGGIPGAYINNIRLDTLQNLYADASQPPNWNFNAATVNTALGTYSPSRWLLLALEYCVAANNVPGNWNLPQQLTIPRAKAAEATIDRRLSGGGAGTQGYQAAGPPLGAQLGKFCSYCEQFLPGQVAVEHCTPKAQFPLFTLCWDNFLLACDACNGPTGKGQNPSRRTVDQWGQFADDCARNVAIRGTTGNPGQAHYLWPDLNPNAYRNLLPVLCYWGNNQWNPLAYADSVWVGSAITGLDLPNRTIIATIQHNGNQYPNQRVAVWLAGANQQATDSIPYYGFDKVGNETGKIADCRMYNRTIAWFKAIQFLAPLQQNLQAMWGPVWPLVLNGAPAIGYLSVWTRVLDLMGFSGVPAPNSNPQVSITRTFLNTLANSPAGFPNTNTANMP